MCECKTKLKPIVVWHHLSELKALRTLYKPKGLLKYLLSKLFHLKGFISGGLFCFVFEDWLLQILVSNINTWNKRWGGGRVFLNSSSAILNLHKLCSLKLVQYTSIPTVFHWKSKCYRHLQKSPSIQPTCYDWIITLQIYFITTNPLTFTVPLVYTICWTYLLTYLVVKEKPTFWTFSRR